METKVCSKCKKELPLEEFRWKNKSLNKKHSQCKQCEKIAEKIRYENNKERRDAILERAIHYKADNLLLVDKHKENGCIKCGDKRPYVLDFHHIEPENKTNTIAHMIKSASFENLEKEINKCVLLCANCHREFHYLEKEKNISFKEYLPR